MITDRILIALAIACLIVGTILMLDAFGSHWHQDGRGAWIRASVIGRQETSCWHWLADGYHDRYAIARTPLFNVQRDICLEWREPWPH